MLLGQTEIGDKIEVLEQIASLLINAQLTQSGQRSRLSAGLSGGHVSSNGRASVIGSNYEVEDRSANFSGKASGYRHSVSNSGGNNGGGGGALAAFIKQVPPQSDARRSVCHGNYSEEGLRGVASVKETGDSSSNFCYEAGLQLPRSCGPDVVAALSELGQALRQACNEIMTAIDDQLISFYEHMKKKEIAELEEICASRRIIPVGFETRAVSTAGGGGGVSALAAAPSILADDTTACDGLSGGVVGQLSTSGKAQRSAAGSRKAHAASGLDAALPRLPTTDAHSAHESNANPKRSGHHSTGRRQHEDFSYVASAMKATTGAGQLGKQLSDGRSAASTLQSFLYLLLEAALTQCAGSCASVYVNDACGGAQEGSQEATSSTQAKQQPSTSTAARFLQSVAHINNDGYLPVSISYATTNTLTTVVQTGVALNLRNSAYRVASSGGGIGPANANEGGEASGREGKTGTAARQQGASTRYLNVSNCVAVPMKHFGVVVIANKRSSATEGVDFTPMDEHVVWSTAMLCENLLTRYRRDLLLQFAWRPSGVGLLRKFSVISSVHGDPKPAKMLLDVKPLDDRSDTGDRYMQKLSDGSTRPHSGGGGSILSFIANREAHKPVAHTLTIVRTADERTLKAVPAELLPRRGGKSGAEEEDLYEGAANYIANLESLWRRSLEKYNTLQNVVDKCDKDAEVKQELINMLESKVRHLTARVNQLERTGPTAVGTARGSVGGRVNSAQRSRH